VDAVKDSETPVDRPAGRLLWGILSGVFLLGRMGSVGLSIRLVRMRDRTEKSHGRNNKPVLTSSRS